MRRPQMAEETFVLKPKVAPQENVLLEERPDIVERPWIEKAGDARRFLKVQVSGDRCGTAPNLVPNPLSTAPYDDKTNNHHWKTLTAFNDGTPLQREMAICASGVGRHMALQDCKGTCCFLQSMEVSELELSKRLGAAYRYDPSWKNRW